MKTFTFTIDLAEDEITNTFMYLASIGAVDKDSLDKVDAVFNYIKAMQSDMYMTMSNNVVDFLISKATPSIEIPPKKIGGVIS